MDPATRMLEQVAVADAADAAGQRSIEDLVEQLMGRRPELRLAFIQANATKVEELDV